MKRNALSNIKAAEVLTSFYDYVDSKPENRLRNFLSYNHGRKMIKAVRDYAWDEIEAKRPEITNWLRVYGSENGRDLSDKTIEFAWAWLARSYEYAIVQGKISRNPFRSELPKPRSGSYID